MARRHVLALPVGGADAPSTRYRLLKLLPFLDSGGLDVKVASPGGGGLPRAVGVCRAGLDLRRADLVFIQKRLIPDILLRAIVRARVPIVFDMDDALFVDQRDPQRPAANSDRLRTLVRESRLVVTGNEYLARWARGLGADVRVIPTAVDTDSWAPSARRPHAGVVLGWMGTSSNLRYLEAISDTVLKALDDSPNSRLVVVSDRPPSLEHRSVVYRPWSLATDLESVADFDIGLMPLSDDPWTRGKCAFKALQCMSLGLPVIASPVGASAEVIIHGRTGLLARDDAEWERALFALMNDESLRMSVGLAARDAAVEGYRLEKAGIALADALRASLDTDRA